MLGSIPHQKFSLYHFPTRGRAGVKLGDAWYVSNVSIIFYGSMLLSCQTLDVLYAFYIFFGTNLLTQCQVPVPVFSVFWPFSEEDFKRCPNGIKLPKRFFRNRRYAGNLRTKAKALGRPQAPSRGLGGTPSRLVGPLWLRCPTSSAYKSPKNPKPREISTKIIFCRRKLLSPQDPIWGTFWCPAGGGFGYGGLLHQHHCLSDDAWVVHHRPSGP